MHIATKIADELPELDRLECSICGTTQPVGDTAEHLANGWPTHCGYTMMLVTKRQTEADDE